MAVVRYKCTVCNRETEIKRNRKGLEVMSKCIITDGCRGNLYQTGIKQDHIRGEASPRVPGLIDWAQRKALYNHEQTIQSTIWEIEHNLGVSPVIQVFINRDTSNGTIIEEVFPTSTTIVDANNIKLTFSEPTKGIAQLVARATRPVDKPNVTQTVSVAAEPTQITNNGELSIARIGQPAGNFTFDIVYILPEGAGEVRVPITVDTTPGLSSPWSDFTTLFLKGKTYHIRSFDFRTTAIDDGTIPEGSSFYFTSTGQSVLESQDQFYILLARVPYQNSDKILDKLIDPSNITATTAISSFIYLDAEMFTYDNAIERTFPGMFRLS